MAWGFDAQAGADQWLEQRVAQQELARRAQQDQQKMMLDRIGMQEQTRQFDTNVGLQEEELGEQTRQFNEEAPTRDAQQGYIRAQTGDIERRPQAELDERAFDREMLGAREASEGRLITKRTDEDIRGVRATTQAQPPVSSAYADERAQRNLQSVQELKGKIGNWTAGPGSALAMIPGTDARDFAAELDTLKANIAFGELTEMRAASKTGGALGQVSERELALLTATLGALDPGQSPENLRAQLDKIEQSIQRWQQAKTGGAGGPAAPGAGGAISPGTKRVINGTPAVWDGQGWVAEGS